MSSTEQETKAYELRLAIEAQMYELLDNGFTTDDVDEFVNGILDDMKEEHDA